jgi:hypothetical protein
MPIAYFYADDDVCTEMLERFHALSATDQQGVLERLKAQRTED